MNCPISFNTLIILAFTLSMIALVGLFWRKNLLIMLMNLEMGLLSIILGLVGASRCHNVVVDSVAPPAILVFFILVIAACEVAIGVSLIIQLYKRYGTIWVDDLADDND